MIYVLSKIKILKKIYWKVLKTAVIYVQIGGGSNLFVY